ncbi:NAD(P)H-dependent oxidoreductase [Janibacter cremeus]|uniref:NAD(P)H-dependent FMN reductase n=1 Tax=Janibacter cremeus TaxID=1285192 RepID=A0A852VNI4_9MICO|nr:NAD(P)H-dependent oxidoreductase [Janibacter cremeus]NYF98607.1 NAD(P)H-dependent FMN reductase [Janibacter cremeus]
MNVVTLVGSLRADSTNRQLALNAIDHLPEGSTAPIFDRVAELPHYSEDIDVEGHVPAVAEELRSAITDADALIVVTPEYNGTLSSVMKNAIDWASRPYGMACIKDTPAIVLAASASARAAQWARADAVRTLQVAGARVVEDTLGVGSSHEAFVEGKLIDPEADATLRTLVCRLVPAPVPAV